MSFEKPDPRILRQQGFSIDRFSKMVVCANGPVITNVRFRSDVTLTPECSLFTYPALGVSLRYTGPFATVAGERLFKVVVCKCPLFTSARAGP
jgi:predicted alpha/beta hydrolase